MPVEKRASVHNRKLCSIPLNDEEAVRCYHAYLVAETEQEADALKFCLVGEMGQAGPIGIFLNSILKVVRSQLKQQSNPTVDEFDLCFEVFKALMEIIQKRRANLLRFEPKEFKNPKALLKALASRPDRLSQYLWNKMPLAIRHQDRELASETPLSEVTLTLLTSVLTACLSDPSIPQLCTAMIQEDLAEVQTPPRSAEEWAIAKAEMEDALRSFGREPSRRRLAHCNRRLLGVLYGDALKAQSDNIIFYARRATRYICIHAFEKDKKQSPATSSLDAEPYGEGTALQIPDPQPGLFQLMVNEEEERQRQSQLQSYFTALWQALLQRKSKPQRASVVLWLGFSVLRWWPPLKIASMRQIAELIDIKLDTLYLALQKPRMNDLEIAKVIGLCLDPPEGATTKQIQEREKAAENQINNARFEAFEALLECRELLNDRLFLRIFHYCLMELQPSWEGGWEISFALFLLHHRFKPSKGFSIVNLLRTQKIVSLSSLTTLPYLDNLERLQEHLPLPIKDAGLLVERTDKEAEKTYRELYKQLKTELKKMIRKISPIGMETSTRHETIGLRTSTAAAS